MSYSLEILDRDNTGAITRLLGTDGSFTLDGRFGYERADYEAMEYYLRIKHIKPFIIGYRLLKDGRKIRDNIFE